MTPSDPTHRTLPASRFSPGQTLVAVVVVSLVPLGAVFAMTVPGVALAFLAGAGTAAATRGVRRRHHSPDTVTGRDAVADDSGPRAETPAR